MNKKCQELLLNLWTEISSLQPKVKTNRNWVDEYIDGLTVSECDDKSILSIVQTLKTFKSHNINQAVFANNMRRQLKRVEWVDYSFPQSILFRRIVTLTSKKRMDILVGKNAMTITSIKPVFKALNKKLSALEKEKDVFCVKSDIETLRLLEESLDFEQGVTHYEIGRCMFNLRWNNLLHESIVSREVNAILVSIIEKRASRLI